MVTVLLYLAVVYMPTTMVVLNDLAQESVSRQNPGTLTLETNFYGELEDLEVISRYRIIRLFKVLIKNIVASVWLAFQHVTCFATFSALIFLVIKHNNLLIQGGLIAFLIIWCCIITPVVIIACEITMFATLANLSDGCAEDSKKLVTRKTMYRKFVECCQTFHVDQAYPI